MMPAKRWCLYKITVVFILAYLLLFVGIIMYNILIKESFTASWEVLVTFAGVLCIEFAYQGLNLTMLRMNQKGIGVKKSLLRWHLLLLGLNWLLIISIMFTTATICQGQIQRMKAGNHLSVVEVIKSVSWILFNAAVVYNQIKSAEMRSLLVTDAQKKQQEMIDSIGSN